MGGAFLRNLAITKFYQKAGFEIVEVFNDEIRYHRQWSDIFNLCWYGPKARILFRKAKVMGDDSDYLHFDNLRQFNWKFSGHGKKKIIYNAHNLEFENFYGREDSFYRKNLFRFELSCFAKAHLSFVCSEREREILVGARPDLEEKILVFPNLVDRKNYKINPQKKTILFIGTLDYFPNVQAIDFLFRKFFPRMIPKYKNNFRFVIAGRRPSKDILGRAKEVGVEVISDLSDADMIDLFSETLITLVPLKSGSGTRLKIIESIMSGANVLATELGAEGVDSQMIVRSKLSKFFSNFEELILKHLNNEWITDDPSFIERFDSETWIEKNKEMILEKMEKSR